MSRSLRLCAVAGFAVLLLGGAAGCGKSGSPAPTTPTTGGAAAKPAAGPATGFNNPDKIGTMTKSADQTQANGEIADLKARQDVTASFSKEYEDNTDNTHTMWVTGEISNSSARWDQSDLDTDLQNNIPQGSPNKPVPTSTGNAGGIAKCADQTEQVAKIVACDWIKDGATVFVHFVDVELAQATSLMTQVLNATVKF
jgi:hypothetical protein